MALTKVQTNEQTAPSEAEEKLTEEGVQATAEQQQEAAQDAPEPETKAGEEQEEAQDAPEPEAKAEEDDRPRPGTAMAERSETAPTANASRATDQFETNMADEGFEGLNLGGLSFEQIRLPGEGQFLIGQEDEELGKEFDCVIQKTRSRYVVRQSDDQDADMYYSYDPKGLTMADGEDASDKLAEWREEGYDEPIIKKYIEVMAIMIDEGGERDRMMVLLSIPPASVQKFSGFIAQQQLMKGKLPNQFITKCMVGKKVKTGNNTFFPWTFKNAGEAPELF